MANVNIVTEGTPTTANSLDLAITQGNAGTTTGTFLTSVTETTAPTTITSTGDLTLDGAGFTLTGNGVAGALRINVGAGGDAGTATTASVTIENLNIANTGTANSIADDGAVRFSNDGSATNYIISAPIAGTGSVTVETANTHAVFSGANTYTGATTVSTGADLILGAGGSIATSASVALTGTGELDVSNTTAAGGTATVALNDLTGAANSTVLIGQNTLTLTENAGAVAGAAAVTEVFAGVISGGSTGNLVLQSGVLELTGANTYAGSTRISGTLELGAAAAIADSVNVALKASGAVLDTSRVGGAVTINQLTGVTGSSIVLGTGNGAGANSSLVINENVASATFGGVISSTAAGTNDSVTVEGGDVLTLTGANTYAGVTNIDAGSGIALSGAGTLGLGEANVGGTLDLSGVTGGTVMLNGLADGVTTAGAAADGTVNLGATNLVVTGTSTFDGVISGTTGALQVGAPAAGAVAASTPTLTLTGVEAYTGSTRIYGTLDLTGTGSIASSANVALKAAGATLDVSDVTGTAANINGDANATAVTINQLTGQAGSTVALGGDNLIVMESGAGTFNGAITGYGDFVVRGPGTLTLNETAPSTGTFDGTLVVGGHVSLLNATQFADANLADNGNVSIASATVAAGAAFEVGGLEGIAGSTLALGSNTLDVTGNVDSDDAYAGVISGAGGLTIGNDVFFTLSGANTYMGVTTTTAGGEDSNPGVLYVDGGSLASTSIVDNGEVRFTSTTFGGVISGAGGVLVAADRTSANTETVVFSGVNTYTGQTEIEGDVANGTAPAQTAVLQIASGGSIAVSSGVTLYGYATLDLSQAGAQTLQGLSSFEGVASTGAANTNSVILGSGNLTIGSGLQTGSANVHADTFDGVISGGTGQLIIAPNETITFSAVQAYTGSTVIQGEVELTGSASLASSANVSLKATAATAAGTGATPTPATIAADGVLDISTVTTSTTTINNLTGQTGTTIDLGAATLVVNETAAGSFSGVIAADNGTGGLTVEGSAYLTLNGANTYTGETLISGSLELGSSTATVQNGNTTTTTTTPGTLASGTIVDDGFFAISADSTVNDFQGTGVLKTMGHTLTDTQGADETFSGVIHGTAGVLNLTGAHTLTLSGSSDFTGGIDLNGASSVHLSALNAAGTGAITFEAGATGTLSIDNAALTGGGTATESFANTIAGSANAGVNGTVDLTDLTFNSAAASQTFTVSSTGTFTITEGATSVTFHTDLTGGTVTAMSDTHGGTAFHFASVG